MVVVAAVAVAVAVADAVAAAVTVAVAVAVSVAVAVAEQGPRRGGGGAMLLQRGFEITCGRGVRGEGGEGRCYFKGALK